VKDKSLQICPFTFGFVVLMFVDLMIRVVALVELIERFGKDGTRGLGLLGTLEGKLGFGCVKEEGTL
jgi:hypothetical protein